MQIPSTLLTSFGNLVLDTFAHSQAPYRGRIKLDLTAAVHVNQCWSAGDYVHWDRACKPTPTDTYLNVQVQTRLYVISQERESCHHRKRASDEASNSVPPQLAAVSQPIRTHDEGTPCPCSDLLMREYHASRLDVYRSRCRRRLKAATQQQACLSVTYASKPYGVHSAHKVLGVNHVCKQSSWR